MAIFETWFMLVKQCHKPSPSHRHKYIWINHSQSSVVYGIVLPTIPQFIYPLVICYSSLLKMAHRNSWLTYYIKMVIFQLANCERLPKGFSLSKIVSASSGINLQLAEVRCLLRTSRGARGQAETNLTFLELILIHHTYTCTRTHIIHIHIIYIYIYTHAPPWGLHGITNDCYSPIKYCIFHW